MRSIFLLLIFSGVSCLASIPADRIPPSGWKDYSFDNPGGWTTINVTDHGLTPDEPNIDTASKINEILEKTEGRRILYFPEGTYYLNSQCTITTGDIQITGDGMDRTIFKITSPENEEIHGFEFKGVAEETRYLPAENRISRGDQQIRTKTETPFRKSDFIMVYSSELSPVEKEFWRGQIFQIEKKQNRMLHFDMKSGIDMPLKKPLKLWRLFMIQNIVLKDFSIERLHKNAREGSNIVFEYCFNVQVSRIRSAKACFSNIRARACKQVIVEHCEMYGAWESAGGWAYGVNFHRATTEARASFNKVWDLRHGINVSHGANHCIFSYNSSNAPYVSYQDVGVHHGGYANNILFEGNFGKEIVTDSSGLNKNRSEYIVYFRNYATSMLGPQQELCENYSVVGNVVENPAGLYLAGKQTFSGLNQAGETLISGSLSDPESLPASLYLSEKPQSLERWPLYGPK